MKTSLIFSSFICGAIVIGCSDNKADETATTKTTPGSEAEDSAEGTSSGSGSTSEVVTSSTSGDPLPPDTDTETPVTSDDGTIFFVPPDMGPGACDVFAQDCPEGQKCAAWASDGGSSWDANKCVPVTGDKVPGDECTTEGGGVSGNDNCEKGSMCWDVSPENIGICVALCTGSTSDPVCGGQGFDCAVVNEAVLNICLPRCDPLLQDCQGDDLCLPVDDKFVCVLDASGEEGQAFDPCEFANACDPGLLCAGAASGNECDPMSSGCCVPMCSLSEMAPCPGAGQECTSLYEEGQAPPAFEDVGYCTIPV